MKKYFYILFILPVIVNSCKIDPDAFFYTDKVEAYVGEEIFFTNDSYNAVEYEWDFGDGTFSNSVDVSHTYLSTGTFTVELTAFSRGGNTDKAYQTINIYTPTILVVEVLEWEYEYAVSNANVRLYSTLSDWDAETNMVIEGNTNTNGLVTFYDLGAFVYYVDVWEAEHNNWDLRGYENDDYIRIPQLTPNEVNTYIAWVDFVGTKGGDERDRSMVIRKIERKPKK